MKEILTFTLRIDNKLHKELLRLSEKDKRSLNAEILYILEKYVEEEKEKKTN